MRDEQGFTLIEMAFVLSVAITLTVIILPFGFKWIQASSEKEALDAIITEIYSLQSYSMANEEYTKLSFQTSGGKTSYIAATPGKEVFAKRELPEGMHISSTSTLKTVEFSGDGNIIKSGVLTIISSSKIIAITFQFQRGRMIIRESERVLMAGSNFNSSSIIYRFRDTITKRYTYYNAFA